MKNQGTTSSGQIIVLGMHRSGTSCVGNLLTKLGAYFGDPSISTGSSDQNRKGFFERRDLRDICDGILQGSGCDWWAINEFSPAQVPAPVKDKARAKFAELVTELDQNQPWFIKEPRLCLVWPLLGGQVTNPVFIHVWRNPIEVARSLAVRNGFPIDFGIALWEAYVRSALAITRGQRSIVISYNELIDNPAATTRRLVKELKALGVGKVTMPGDAQLRDAIDDELYRERQTSSDLDELVTSSQQELVQALKNRKLAGAKLFAASSPVSHIRLHSGTRQEGAIVALRNDVAQARRKTAELRKSRDISAAAHEEKLRGLRKSLTDGEHESHRLAEEYARKIRELERELAERDDRIGALREQLTGLADAATKRELRLAELEMLPAVVTRLESEIFEKSAVISDGEKRIAALHYDVDRQKQIQELQQAETAALNVRLAELADAATKREHRLAELEVLPAIVTRLENEIVEKGVVIAGGEERIAALQNEIRRDDQYIEDLKGRITGFREKAGRAFNHALEHARASGKLEFHRAQLILRFEHTPWLHLLFKGAGSAADAKPRASRSWYALFLHYLLCHRRKDASDLALLAISGWFDPKYYVKLGGDGEILGVDSVIHYVDHGAQKGRNPSPLFDSTYYLQANNDVAKNGMNPLVHFIKHGQAEGRAPRPPRALEAFRAAQTIMGNFSVPPPPARRLDPKPSQLSTSRIVIYTAIAGGYDDLRPPEVMPPNCDFVVFSDQPIAAEGWQVRPLNYFSDDPTRSARFAKLHPHVYFPDYDHSIWIDANIGIRGDLRVFLEGLTDESPVSIFVHPLRDCIYVEAQECIKRKKDSPNAIDRHVGRYRAEGFPENGGLWETNVVVRRHNDASCISLMTAWWREIETGSRRDQLSLPVVAERLSAKIAPLGLPGEDARNHPLLALSKHPSERAGGDGRLPAAARRKVEIDAMPIDVGVCVHNSPGETEACLESVLKGRRPQDRLIIVDDASDASTATLLEQIAKDRDGVTLVRHEQNRGYTHSANDVLKNARSPWVVLLNSDTIVPARALPKLVMGGEQFPALAVVGPLSNAAGWQTVPQLTGPDGKFMINNLPGSLTADDMDRLCEELSDGVVPFVPLVNGFCFAIRRSAVEQIGPFDEANFQIGYGEEDDFCLRAGAAGLLCGLATDSYVFHSKSASFTPERRVPLVAQGGKALRAKHSPERVAAAVETMKRHPYLALVRQRIGEAVRKHVPAPRAV